MAAAVWVTATRWAPAQKRRDGVLWLSTEAHRFIGRQHNTRGCRERAATTVAYRFGSRTEGWRRRDEALPCRVGAVQVEPEQRRSRS